MRTKQSLVIVHNLAAALLLSGCAGTASARELIQQTNPTEPNRTLTVTGVGTVAVTPDIAYVTIGVHTEDKDAKTAVNTNSTLTTKVISAIKAQGIDPKDIQTTNFSITPQQQYDAQNKPLGITYLVDNSVSVTVRDLEGVGALLDAAVQAGANSINSIQFDVADRAAAQAKAIEAAILDAETQAKVAASATAGVTLGPVQSLLVVNGSAAPAPMYAARSMMDASAAPPISAGQMEITVSVNLVYSLAQ